MISYQPPSASADGKWHKINLSVKGLKDYRVRAKEATPRLNPNSMLAGKPDLELSRFIAGYHFTKDDCAAVCKRSADSSRTSASLPVYGL